MEETAHGFELPQSDTLYLKAVLRQMGVGGYDSWGAHTLEEHKIKSGKTYQFSFTLLI